jgi:hypothetical protein
MLLLKVALGLVRINGFWVMCGCGGFGECHFLGVFWAVFWVWAVFVWLLLWVFCVHLFLLGCVLGCIWVLGQFLRFIW